MADDLVDGARFIVDDNGIEFAVELSGAELERLSAMSSDATRQGRILVMTTASVGIDGWLPLQRRDGGHGVSSDQLRRAGPGFEIRMPGMDLDEPE